MSGANEETKGNILVVDDTPANLRLLSRLLTDNGFKVRPVPNGRLALDAVKAAPPDAILLDVRMPEMDGYQVCEVLKQDAQVADIPVIFISALHEMQDKIKGFEVGGVDYVTKPFQEEEVLIRLKTHLTIRNQQRRMQEQYDELRKLEIMRETLTQMIVHDLNNTLQAILGYSEILLQPPDTLAKDDIDLCANSIACSAKITIEMIRAILDVAKLEANQMTLEKSDLAVAEVINEVREGMSYLLQHKEVTLAANLPPSLPLLQADREIFRRIMVNLIGNAAKFSPVGGQIAVAVSTTETEIRIDIADQGPGIPSEYKERIFEKFGQVESRKSGQKYSTGLGLTFCKMAVEAHGGSIGVRDNTDEGSTFWFSLPLPDSSTVHEET